MIGEDDCTARPIASIVTRHAPDRPQCVLFLNREDLGLSDRVVPSFQRDNYSSCSALVSRYNELPYLLYET